MDSRLISYNFYVPQIILLWGLFFQSFEVVKAILNLRIVHNKAVGWFCLVNKPSLANSWSKAKILAVRVCIYNL